MKPRHALAALAAGLCLAAVAYCAAVTVEHDRVLSAMERRLTAIEQHYPAEVAELRRAIERTGR